jgi:hypothetical protein
VNGQNEDNLCCGGFDFRQDDGAPSPRLLAEQQFRSVSFGRFLKAQFDSDWSLHLR